MPTSAFAPPPKVDDNTGADKLIAPSPRTLPTTDTHPASTVKSAPLPRAPGSECVDTCSQTWESCLGTCRGAKDKCDTCEVKHASCLAGCVKKLKADLSPKFGRAAKGQ
jgi:hypothetical protein